jgi:hypothetical protein
MHSPTRRLRNDDHPAVMMMARNENRYPDKYKGGYEAAAP